MKATCPTKTWRTDNIEEGRDKVNEVLGCNLMYEKERIGKSPIISK
jgi:hypothetical protein